MSTIIIGGNGRAAIQRLVDAYPNMDHDRKAAAVALEHDICEQIDAFLSDGDQDEDGQ
ncbi:MAG TPA: hypothetical protein VHQ21_11950 [Rhodanobacteraceae bacterium]|jgi:hypothetical protein|nr:hypothetical protein [Rhodanobacteraceae bacterium]